MVLALAFLVHDLVQELQLEPQLVVRVDCELHVGPLDVVVFVPILSC